MSAKSEGRLELVMGAILLALGGWQLVAGTGNVVNWLVVLIGAFGIWRGASLLRRANSAPKA